MSAESSPLYIAIIGDLVGSRQLEERGRVQKAVEGALSDLNRKYSDEIVSRFMVTLGDEFQGLVRSDARIDAMWWTYVRHVGWSTRTRFGFGLGALETDLREEALGMDGPCFHRAREAIEEAKDRELLFAFRLSQSEWNAAFDDASCLVNRVMVNWSPVQWETAALYEKYGNQSVVAEQREVSRQTVNASLASSLAMECIQSLRGFTELLRLEG